MYDAIVIGARCAGSPTAMLLARHGHRVLLVDRSPLGSDTFSGNFIHPPGVAALRRWGVLEALRRTNAPPIDTVHFDVGPFALSGRPPAIDGVRTSYAPRRTILDALLANAAMAAGAEFRDRFRVDGLLFEGDRVCGIRSTAPSGATVEERARIVIGADGKNSSIARLVGAPRYNEQPARTCNYGRYYSNLPVDGNEIYVRPGHFAVAVPTHDDLTLVNVLAPVGRFKEYRSDINGTFLSLLESAPSLYARVHAAQPASRFMGTVDTNAFFRRPWGNGWALVGDAGYYRDPITAQGMTDAFLDAELLAGAVHGALSGAVSPETALQAYERLRNERVQAMYSLTADLAQLAPPNADMQSLFAALADSQEDTDEFLGTVAGTVPIPRFFSPENVTRIIGSRAFYAGRGCEEIAQ